MADKGFFWLHIKKCGGESFRKTFSPPYVLTDRSINCRTFISLPKEEWNDALNNYRIPLGEYDYRRMLFAKKFLYTKDEFDSLFKFTIVRNPYSRAVSSWKYLMGEHSTKKLLTSPSKLKMKLSFARFLEELPRLWEKKYNRLLATHTAPIWPDITDEEEQLLVDKLLYLESINDGIDYLNQHLDLSIKKFEHINKSRRSDDYRKHYNKKTRALVEKYYGDDIENLKYEF